MKKTDCKAFADYILQKKNLTKEQKAKISELVARDYSKIYSELDNLNVVASLETQVSSEVEPQVAPGNPHYPKLEYRSPKHLQRFMELLNNSKDDVILQYTSHLVSSDVKKKIIEECGTEKYELKKHTQLIYEHFQRLVETLKKDVPDCNHMKIVSMVRAYMTGKAQFGKDTEGWTRDHITDGWGNKDFLEWGKNNPGVVPNPEEDLVIDQNNRGYILKKDRKSLLTGKRIHSFSDLLLYYKSLIVIREEYSLRTALDYSNQKLKEKYNNIEFQYKENGFNEYIERYTDVETIIQVYEKIVWICRKKDIERSKKDSKDIITHLELSFYEEGDDVCLSIHHLNSICYGKTIHELRSSNARIGELQRQLINDLANGLCDIFIEAEFPEKKYARYALWAEDGGSITEITEMKGVKYIIRF